MRALLLLTYILLGVSAHEGYSPDLKSYREPEHVPALEPYNMTYVLDQPLSINSDFFFNEIVDADARSFRKDNIFGSDNDEEQEATNWILWFTSDDNPRFECILCRRFDGPAILIAKELQMHRSELNYKVAKVDCFLPEAVEICRYFGLSNVP